MTQLRQGGGAERARQFAIASAVEEQTATTQEMNRTLADAAGGAGTIATTGITIPLVTRVPSQPSWRAPATVDDRRAGF